MIKDAQIRGFFGLTGREMGHTRDAAPAIGRAPVRDRPRSGGPALCDVLSAVSAILTASKINLANVALTIKVQTHEELEERVTETEQRIDAARAK